MNDEFLIKRIFELSDRCYRDNYPINSDFLSESELSEVYGKIKHQDIISSSINSVSYLIYGGREDADRNMICFIPDYMERDQFLEIERTENNLIKLLLVSPLNEKFVDSLSHRDFLGTLMGLGIKREKIGDIILDNQNAYIYVAADMASYIKDNLFRVKHTSMKVKELPLKDYEFKREFKNLSFSVASVRLDNIISGILNFAREKAKKLIKSEKVYVNGKIISDPAYKLDEEDKISIRGFGKYIYESEGGRSRKGKTYVSIKKYI